MPLPITAKATIPRVPSSLGIRALLLCEQIRTVFEGLKNSGRRRDVFPRDVFEQGAAKRLECRLHHLRQSTPFREEVDCSDASVSHDLTPLKQVRSLRLIKRPQERCWMDADAVGQHVLRHPIAHTRDQQDGRRQRDRQTRRRQRRTGYRVPSLLGRLERGGECVERIVLKGHGSLNPGWPSSAQMVTAGYDSCKVNDCLDNYILDSKNRSDSSRIRVRPMNGSSNYGYLLWGSAAVTAGLAGIGAGCPLCNGDRRSSLMIPGIPDVP